MGCGYMFHNMFHSTTVLRSTNVFFHMHYLPLLHCNINFLNVWIFMYTCLHFIINVLCIWIGEERSKQVTLVLNENREMMDSFTVISLELSTLAKNLQSAEEQRKQQKEVSYTYTESYVRVLKYVRDFSTSYMCWCYWSSYVHILRKEKYITQWHE